MSRRRSRDHEKRAIAKHIREKGVRMLTPSGKPNGLIPFGKENAPGWTLSDELNEIDWVTPIAQKKRVPS